MNLASGNSSTKIHWSRGAYTACNKKMSTNKIETIEFKDEAAKNPEICCSKCLAKLKTHHN